MAQRLPRRPLPAQHHHRPRPRRRDAGDRHHVGPLGRHGRDGARRACRRRWTASAAAAPSPAASPTSTPTARRPTTPGRAWVAAVPSWRCTPRSSRPPPTPSWPPAAPSPTTTPSVACTAPGTTSSAPISSPKPSSAAKRAVDPNGVLNPGILVDV